MPSDNTSDDDTRDRRPKPQYGELAPEGWVWEPPTDPSVSEVPPVGAPLAGPPPAEAPTQQGASTGVAARQGQAPLWDRPVTLGLLVLGLFGTFLSISILNSLPQAIQMAYTQEGLGTYSAADNVDSILLGGVIAQVILWAVTATGSILLLVRSRRAFYVPLIGGILSLVLIFVFMGAVLAGDATLLDSIAGTR
ncbi:DUF6264 family protein [Cryobacterium psychrophilum]|uniref:Uncharacterized protein n=1 Tax=Cryobacterium psychrophilum TaxID=41988 RepID=A0A4Y8KKL9_9MICO|nr:DUF6264 family protein [Cryobacterium psychrophilum]TDW30838.1 hypothetical protein EDD25_2615 [Cryobacterium psychrophilum]TFD75772.1 hypothetical protein E3T53_14935 [Cryobacterium psychrophilum]